MDPDEAEDLRIMRGILFALPIAAALWLVFAAIAYGIYWVIAG